MINEAVHKAPLDYVEYFPGIYHIADSMGVHMTLIILQESGQAVLFDCGYGLADPKPFISSLLGKHNFDIGNLPVIISHGHRDHVLGARWFDSFYIHENDVPLIDIYTSESARMGALEKARYRKVVPDGFNEAAFYQDNYHSRIRPGIPSFDGIDIIHLPGHTPGSLVLYIHKYQLLLSSDNWNPTTWLFFPEALPVKEYSRNMRTLLSLDFKHVLCAHSGELIPGKRLRNFINGLTDENFSNAVEIVTPYPQYKTGVCHPEPETNFVFLTGSG